MIIGLIRTISKQRPQGLSDLVVKCVELRVRVRTCCRSAWLNFAAFRRRYPLSSCSKKPAASPVDAEVVVGLITGGSSSSKITSSRTEPSPALVTTLLAR